NTIDAAEWVGPYDDAKLKFYEVAKFYYYPGWWEPGPTLSFYVNQSKMDGLPASYKAALECAMAEANQRMQVNYDTKNPIALGELVGHGVQLRKFSDDILAAAKEKTEAKVDQLAEKNPAFKKILGPWQTFRDESYRWFNKSEQGFAEFSFPGA
ncbi:MAG: ABC transporter substrate-binding protein, partial [Verrucomicrobiota bacterium]